MYLLVQVGAVLRLPGSSDRSVSEEAFGVLGPWVSQRPAPVRMANVHQKRGSAARSAVHLPVLRSTGWLKNSLQTPLK